MSKAHIGTTSSDRMRGTDQALFRAARRVIMFGRRIIFPGIMTAGLILMIAGCDTLSQDFQAFNSMINPKSPSEAARDMVDPYDADRRRLGTVLISSAPFGGVQIYLDVYRDRVDHERDPIVKAASIRALARHGEPEDALRILPHLSHENVQVRWEAAKGLQRLHNEAVVSDLLHVLRNDVEQADVRIAAAIALGQYPQHRVFQELVAALDERELALNLAAEESLESLTGKSFGLDAPRWLSWYNQTGASETAFEDRQEYLYPTYHRDETFLEKVVFWTARDYEQPAQPAGLRPKHERRTYPEEEEDTSSPGS